VLTTRDNRGQLATNSHGLRGHELKLFMPRCSTTARRTFFSSRVIGSWNSLPQHVISECLQEQIGHTGQIWAYKAKATELIKYKYK